MEDGRPSRTAFGAASHRAVHQLFDAPVLFNDPLSLTILGADTEGRLREAGPEAHAARRVMRALIVARSLVAEQTLAAAVARGVDQYVLLGAGLDTFAYRNPYSDLRVFEVDYPATQAWKRAQLAQTGIAIPSSLTYAPVDFERETLAQGLARAGVDPGQPAVFAWLGVIPYLTREAITATLTAIAAFPAGSEVVFDYSEPRENLPAHIRAFAEARAKIVADLGEPWISFFQPADMAELLKQAGFSQVEDLNGEGLNARFFTGRDDGLTAYTTGHVLRARV